MLKIIIGTSIAITAIYYGVTKVLEGDCDCHDLEEDKISSVNSLGKFYNLKQTIDEYFI